MISLEILEKMSAHLDAATAHFMIIRAKTTVGAIIFRVSQENLKYCDHVEGDGNRRDLGKQNESERAHSSNTATSSKTTTTTATTKMVSNMDTGNATKGKEIRFVKGEYKGKTGWINSAKTMPKKSIYDAVVVDKEEEGEFVTKVWKTSHRPRWEGQPKSLTEAAIRDNPEIEFKMIELAELVAGIYGINIHEVEAFFCGELVRAVSHQVKLGTKAKWTIIPFTKNVVEEEEDDEMRAN